MLTSSISVNGRTIISIRIVNDGTGTKEIGNYNVTVVHYGRTYEFRVKKYPRVEGAENLVQLALGTYLNEDWRKEQIISTTNQPAHPDRVQSKDHPQTLL